MKYADVQVGMLVYLKDGFETKFKKCVGRVIAKRKVPNHWGENILLNFDNTDPNVWETSGHYESISHASEYIHLPEALERPEKRTRWWVEASAIAPILQKTYDGDLL